MSLVEKAFSQLYPDRNLSKYSFSLSYSGRFSPYNGNVRYGLGKYEFTISRLWRGVSEEIVIGLLQHLMQKVFKTKIRTLEQDLYDTFIKNVHVSVPKDKVDPDLKESFDRVNDRYFLGTVEMPNLVWGKKTFRKLGSYEYAADTITMSEVFKDISEENKILLDYVMFHEMLHKVHKFKTTNGRSLHHSKKFRDAEKEFEGFGDMEKELSKFLRKKRFRHSLGLD
ncbi:hypothetical protein H6503_02405 [Candidatus Woesearchaeota archaeon]|nr:hypothetical protein [Candidatus Woesearchaeota archaeon]